MFNYAVMAHTPADSPEIVNGRITEIPLEQLTGDYNQKNFMIKFRVNETRGNNAFTSFDGHRLTSDYKRALTRRRNSRIDYSSRQAYQEVSRETSESYHS